MVDELGFRETLVVDDVVFCVGGGEGEETVGAGVGCDCRVGNGVVEVEFKGLHVAGVCCGWFGGRVGTESHSTAAAVFGRVLAEDVRTSDSPVKGERLET